SQGRRVGGRGGGAAGARPAPRVSDVAIAGAAGDESALQSRLKLKANDRFSFFQWQDDRDRLEAYYHERQHLEARVLSRRAADPSETARVRLAYDVRPGPRTAVA